MATPACAAKIKTTFGMPFKFGQIFSVMHLKIKGGEREGLKILKFLTATSV